MSKKVTGIYKKSRTKGMDKPDPKRRGAAAFKLLKEIEAARFDSKHGRKHLKRSVEENKEMKAKMKAGGRSSESERHFWATFPRGGYHQKVDANRQVQALKKAYDNLPEPEKDAGRKMTMRDEASRKRSFGGGVDRPGREHARRMSASASAKERLSFKDALTKAESEFKAKAKKR